MLEKHFQSKLIKKLYQRYPDCIVLKTDPTYKQGLPDLLVLIGKRWLALEVKKSKNAHHQPNQDYYVNKMNRMSFARFISPENEEEVLREIQQSFKPCRHARVSKSKPTSMAKL